MVNRDQIESFMKNFPSQALILTMEPEDLGAHMLKYMMRGQAETNRFNFMQMVHPGQIAERFMEAWAGSSARASSRTGRMISTDTVSS
jgi:hypothetical protein